MPLIIAILALIGAGGTIAASDSARPGDLLFPVDRSVEDIRFALTPENGKAELKVKFAEERLDEIESILKDEEEDATEEKLDDLGDEEATSTPSEASGDAKENLSRALDILTIHLAEVRGLASTTPGVANAIEIITARLASLTESDALPEELKLRIRSDRGGIELETEDEKIKVKVDDGEIEVEIESEGEDEDGDDDSDNRGTSANSGPGSFNSGSGSTNSGVNDDDDSDANEDISDTDDDSALSDDDADDTDDNSSSGSGDDGEEENEDDNSGSGSSN